MAFSASSGERTLVAYKLAEAAETRLQVLRTTDFPPTLNAVRTLRDWSFRPAGIDSVTWDGRDDAGQLVPPGPYALRAQARTPGESLFCACVGWVGVG
jgi:flagellar hook assembly protein FlgD